MTEYNGSDDDFDGFPASHRIVCRSGWATCNGRHQTPAEVRACYEAVNTPGAWPCTWLMEGRYDDGSIYTYECGAATTYTENEKGVQDGRYECARGHNYIPMEVMAAEGLAYASDDDERDRLMRLGVQPLQMDGSVYH
jgi:hypothetical protein